MNLYSAQQGFRLREQTSFYLAALSLATFIICSADAVAAPNNQLRFFGGITDPGVATWQFPFPDPDTTLEGFNIVNCIGLMDSGSEYQIQTGINTFNGTGGRGWYSLDDVYARTRSKGWSMMWYGGYEGSISGSWFPTWGNPVATLTNFVIAASTRYPNVEYINYANEVLNSGTNWVSAFGGTGSTGYDWVINIGKLFRQYFPHSQIGVNDFCVESTGNDLPYGPYGSATTKLASYKTMCQALRNAGVLDWIGLECYSLETVSDSNFNSALNQLGAICPQIILTEFSPDSYIGHNDATQKSDWQRLLGDAVANQYVIGVIGPWAYRYDMANASGWGSWIWDNRNNRDTLTLTWLKSYIPTVVGDLFPQRLSAAIAYVQGNYATPQTPQTTVTVTYSAAQTAGHLNVVIVGWNDTTAVVNSVSDTKGNSYQLAVGPTVLSGAVSQAIYYAKNIVGAAANANQVTVNFSTAAVYPDVRVLEYSGIDRANPLDVTALNAGINNSSSTSSVATSNSLDLLVGANTVQTYTTGPGSDFTARITTSPDGDIAEDRVVRAPGLYNASAVLGGGAGGWIMQLVAFRAANSPPPAPPIVRSPLLSRAH